MPKLNYRVILLSTRPGKTRHRRFTTLSAMRRFIDKCTVTPLDIAVFDGAKSMCTMPWSQYNAHGRHASLRELLFPDT